MFKKPISKLLSVILTVSICVTTVFGCLLTANAADAPSYVITGAQCEQGDTIASATVTFNVPNGMAAGEFTIDGDWFSSVAVSALPFESGSDVVNISNEGGNVVFYITDDNGDESNVSLHTTVSFKLDFVFSGEGITDDIAITISDLDLNGLYADENYTDFVNNSTDAAFTCGCQHKFVASGNVVYESTELEYTVYDNAVCELCGEPKNAYQVVPALSNDGNDSSSISTYSGTADVTLEGNGTKELPYIISSADEFAAVALGYIANDSNTYFKVADGITAFYMNGGEQVASMTNATDVKNYFTTASNLKNWGYLGSENPNFKSNHFFGNFDGNGVTVYGLYSKAWYASLFPKTGKGAVIKNISIKNSYIESSSGEGASAAGIVGTAFEDSSAANELGLVIENVAVVNNVIISNVTNDWAYGGIVYAHSGNYAVNVTNCVVYGNDATYTNYPDNEMPLFTYSNASTVKCKFNNIISIGHSLEGKAWWTKAIDNGMFTNIYSDRIDDNTNYNDTWATKYNLVTLTQEQMLGSAIAQNAPTFEWGSVWATGKSGEAPVLVLRKDVSAYSSAINDTELSGSGTDTDPYLITSANELLAVISATATKDGVVIDSDGKYFEVADGIKAFYMNGGETVANLTSAAEVKAHFEANGSSYKEAVTGNAPTPFRGTFDGNGAAVYGLYYNTNNWNGGAGLFPTVAGTVVIKNVAVRNSYLRQGKAGGIAGNAYTTFENISLTLECCESSNNYISAINNAGGAGGLVGYMYNNATQGGQRTMPVNINNCLVYGNELVSESELECSAISGVCNDPSNKYANSVFLGYVPYVTAQYHTKNPANYSNCYTDQSLSTSDQSYKANQLAQFDTTVFQGSNATDIVETLNTSNGTEIWFVGKSGEYPTLLEGYDVTVSDTTDYSWRLLGANVTYKDDGGFALNFHYLPANNNNASLYVTNSTNEYKTQVLTEVYDSSFAGTTLPDGTKMFTLDNLSARDIDLTWLATVVTTSDDGSEIVYSETQKISIADYAEEVVLGGAFYDEEATDAEKLADKKVAAALINYGKASDDALNSTTVEGEGKVEVFTAESRALELLDPSKPNSEENPYIIATANQMYNFMVGNSTIDGAQMDTTGKYFKVADGVKAFVMNGGEGIMELDSAAEVKAYFEEGSGWKTVWSSTERPFKGHFDGNGVTVYGIYGHSDGVAGMIPYVAGNVTVKNIVVKNSYLKGANYAGGLIGSANTGTTLLDSISISNCEVSNNYIASTKEKTTGGLAGALISAKKVNDAWVSQTADLSVDNCLVYNNEIVTTYEGGKVGAIAADFNDPQNKISNSVFLGYAPSNNNSYHEKNQSNYSNCYTDQVQTPWDTQVYTANQLAKVSVTTGSGVREAMPNLDWDNVWLYGAEGEYPSIVPTTKVITSSTYSGTDDTTLTGSGTEADPYLITSADEFAAVVKGKVSGATQDTHFKVADGLKAFYMNGGATVAGLSSVEEVKAYFTSASGLNNWSGGTFTGQFNGNGVTVYGLYSTAARPSLFGTVKDHSSIKNIALKNSYLNGDHSQSFGALVACTLWQGDEAATDSVDFENITIANNYVCNNNDVDLGAGIVLGHAYDKDLVTINNCLAYGNEFASGYTGGEAVFGLITVSSGGQTEVSIKNVVSIGVAPWPLGKDNKGAYKATNYLLSQMNQGKMVNIYTDQSFDDLRGYYEWNNNAANCAKYNVNVIDPEDMKGSAAITTTAACVAANKAANGESVGVDFAWGTTWFAGNFNDYPSFAPAASMPSNIQSQYDSVTFDVADIAGADTEYHANGSMSFGVYQTALSLKANPYMSFAFAFLGEYRENRDKIKIRFTYTENGVLKTTEEISVPAYTGEDIKNVNGWTNTAANGRYHTFKADMIPVEALAYGIKVEANYDNTGWKDFGTYSASGLGLQFERLNRITPCEYYETRVEAVKALLFYAQAISARYGAQ